LRNSYIVKKEERLSVHDVKLEKLKDVRPEEFKEFGYIVGRAVESREFVAVTPEFVAYTDLIPKFKNEKGRFSVGLLMLNEKPEGELIEWTEYHEGSYELFFPMGGKQIVFVMAPPGPVPEIEKTRAFLIGPNEGIMLNKKVWHHPPFSVQDVTPCVMPRFGDLVEREGRLTDRKTNYYGENYRGYTGEKIGEYRIRIVL
jgi:ureidoglycolate hydrolase